MSEQIKAFWLGIFILMAILIMGWFMLFLKPSLGDGKVLLTIRFSNIDKIDEGTRVTFAGKPIGEVKAIQEVTDPRDAPADEFGNLYIYELLLKVDSRVHVYSYDEIIFSTSGLLGEKSIAIIPKQTPPGAPPAKEVTYELLYARSTDKLEETFQKLTKVAQSFGETIQDVNLFISDTTGDLNATLQSITAASDAINIFLSDATDKNFIERAALATDALATTLNKTHLLITDLQEKNVIESVHQLVHSEGTLGKLLHSDSLYLQISGMICKVDTLLNDINHYGLLFQYDKGWQRSRTARINKMQRLSTPCDFYNYFDEEMGEITISLNRVGQLLQTMECRDIPIKNPCFSDNFRQLLNQVDCLQNSLKLYTEMLLEEYCQTCN